jgi:hypothetical protein
MDIEQAKQEKRKASQLIASVLHDFTTKTGVYVCNVSLVDVHSTFGGTPKYQIEVEACL